MIDASTMEDSGLIRRDAFAHVDSWVFDLDDTLYPRSIGLHHQMKQRVVLFIAEHLKIDHAAAEAVHLDYYERYGATLQGLVELRVVFTNASRRHADAALQAMGMADLFDGISSIENGEFVGKPHRSAYQGLCTAHGIDPRRSAMFEDRPGNLLVPKEMGMRTVLVVEPLTGSIDLAPPPDHVDAAVVNLTAFLRSIAHE